MIANQQCEIANALKWRVLTSHNMLAASMLPPSESLWVYARQDRHQNDVRVFFLLNVASVTKFSSLLINSNPHSTTVTYSLLTGNLNLLFRRQDGLHPADVGKHPSLVGQELIIRHLPCALQARVVQSFLVQQPTNWPHIQPQLLHAILSVPVFSQLTPRWADISQNTKFLQLLKRHANWMPLLEPILD